MVIGSSMPRLLAGPCLSVILPAASSIFLTSPPMAEFCAAAVVKLRPTASTTAAAMRMIWFIVVSNVRFTVSSFHGDMADHAVVAMVGDQAGKFEGAGLGERPEDLGGLVRRKLNPV